MNKKKKTKKKKYSIKNAKIISKKRYTKLLKKKRKTKKEKEQLDKALFVNYCKCIKRLKYSKKYKKGQEYPICISSVYIKRNIKYPKDIVKKCKKYR